MFHYKSFIIIAVEFPPFVGGESFLNLWNLITLKLKNNNIYFIDLYLYFCVYFGQFINKFYTLLII